VNTVAEVAAGVVVIGAGSTATAGALATHRVRDALRLVPGRPTGAPVSWVVHPGRPAQMHRRLRRACRTVTGAVGTPSRSLHPSRRRKSSSPLTRVGAELIDRAVLLDARVVAADKLSASWRRATLHELDGEVRSIEAAALRVWRLDSVWREHQRAQDPLLGDPSLETQLDAMEAAMVELQVRRPPA
jgi:hypothetical protein